MVYWNWYQRFKEWCIKSKSKYNQTGFELGVSQSRSAICFSIIAIPKKSHFTIFVIENFVQNTHKNMWIRFILLGSCLLGKWMVFSSSRTYGFYWNNGTQILHCKMQNVFCLWQAFNGPSGVFFVIQNICVNYNPTWVL